MPISPISITEPVHDDYRVRSSRSERNDAGWLLGRSTLLPAGGPSSNEEAKSRASGLAPLSRRLELGFVTDVHMESEVLLRGLREGATVIHP